MPALIARDFTDDDSFRDAAIEYLSGAPDLSDDLRDATKSAIKGRLPELVGFAQKVWDAGAAIDPALMILAAGLLHWIDMYSFFEIGSTDVAKRMRLGLLRDAGVEGTWPAAADDPARGVPAGPEIVDEGVAP
ncbi:hypothetical protein [uncultured Sphingomonas sp.]|uniref:hypothetical protein n=1 Tax=uncultured Sphingomonas sp. TaxID=158754 RepID=UPI0025CC050F|nr:hypothetical protein [uncultured Sphingomonas sp.]